MALQGLLCVGDLRPSSTRRLDLRSASDARGTKAVFTARENAPAGLHEREAKGDVCCLRHRYELVRNLYKLKPPPVRCMTFSCLFVHRAGGFRVRRAGRARQGATDAPRRTRRSLKSERGASAADRRRRFDMPGRFSWSRVSAHPSPHPNPFASFAFFAAKPIERGSPKGSGMCKICTYHCHARY